MKTALIKILRISFVIIVVAAVAWLVTMYWLAQGF